MLPCSHVSPPRATGFCTARSTVPAKGGGESGVRISSMVLLFFLRLLLCAQRSYLEPRDIPFCRPSTAYSPGRALYRALRGSVGGCWGEGRGGEGRVGRLGPVAFVEACILLPPVLG